MDRRHFLMGSAVAAGAASRLFASPSDTVRVAVIGIGGRAPRLGGRGKSHLDGFGRLANVQIAAVADPDQTHLDFGLSLVEKNPKQGKRPAGYIDFRKILDDKSIDAITIATPNQPAKPKWNSQPNHASRPSMARCMTRATAKAAGMPTAWGRLCSPAARSCSKS